MQKKRVWMFSIFCNEGKNGLLKFEIKIKLFLTISFRLYGSVHLTSLDKIQKIYECLLVAQVFYLFYFGISHLYFQRIQFLALNVDGIIQNYHKE